MQYLFGEVRGEYLNASSVFNAASEAIKYLQKINKNQRWFVGDREVNAEMLQGLIKDRLSTVSV